MFGKALPDRPSGRILAIGMGEDDAPIFEADMPAAQRAFGFSGRAPCGRKRFAFYRLREGRLRRAQENGLREQMVTLGWREGVFSGIILANALRIGQQAPPSQGPSAALPLDRDLGDIYRRCAVCGAEGGFAACLISSPWSPPYSLQAGHVWCIATHTP